MPSSLSSLGAIPYSPGTSSLSQLIMQQGQNRAQSALQSGQIWGNFAQNLGQTIQGGIQDYQQNKVAQQKQALIQQKMQQEQEAAQREQQAAQLLTEEFSKPEPDRNRIIAIAGPEKGLAMWKASQVDKPDVLKTYGNKAEVLRDAAQGILAAPAPMRQAAYQHRRDGLLATGAFSPEEIPEQYDEGSLTSAANYGVAPKIPDAPKAPGVGTFEDYVTRTYGAQPSPEQIIKARKDYQQADDRPIVVNNGGGPGGMGGLDDDAITATATQYRLLGTKGIPTRLGEADKVRVINEAAKQAKTIGQSPAATVQKQAAFKADGTALTQMAKMKASAESFENKARGQADIIRGLSAKLPRTSIVALNKAIQAGQREFSDPNAQMLANAITTYTSEYAKIMEGSTGSAAGSSDAARKASERLISAGQGHDSLLKTLDLMDQEMGLTIGGYDATIGHISDRMTGEPHPAPTVSAPAAGGFDPAAYQQKYKY